MKKTIFGKLDKIEKKYRPIPFWSWNDKLDPELLRWQVREMEKSGHGGYFMHARGGLQTEYLGEEWMECVEACLDEAHKTDMEPWLYDEDGWPSGFGGGKVTELGDKYHGRWLVIEKFATKEEAENADIANLLNIFEIEGKVYVVSHKSNPYYIDVMSHDAVAEFIKSTHQAYYERFKESFNGHMKGFFTDEPRLSGDFEGDVPWSYDIPEEFLNTHGYDILDNLYALFMKSEGYEKIRYDFYQTVNDMFVKHYMKQIQDWCNEHNCKLTGHVMMEESIFTQMTGTAGVMPFYEYMDVPGIDSLRRAISSPIMPRQLSSAAHQTGKKQTLTESFALTGWNVRMEELKWIIDWQLVNGVNLLCQHLEGYTLRGLRKRDYPPSLFYQIPWWEKYKILNDYVSRIGKMLAEGEYSADVLLLHPMRSGWIVYEGNQNDEIIKIDDDFTYATEFLSGLQVEYDLGDEGMLKRLGGVDGDKIRLGQAEYRAVVLPSMVAIDENTAKMLIEFAANGGKVISMGDFPQLVSGKKENEILTKLKKCTVCIDGYSQKEKLEEELRKAQLISCELVDASTSFAISEIHSRGFEYEGANCRLLVNHDQEETYSAVVAIKGDGTLYEMDLLTAGIKPVEKQTKENGFVKVETVFEPMQSRMFVMIKAAETKTFDSYSDEVIEVSPIGEWDIEDMSENAMTLDVCSYRIDGGKWREPKAVIHIFQELLELKRECEVSLKFNFKAECDKDVLRDSFLAIERANEFEIMVNGNSFKYEDNGYWMDSSFLKADIGELLVQGDNEIVLTRNFYQSDNVYHVLFDEDVYETELNKLTYDVELESIYLVGRFGVKSLSKYDDGDREANITDGPFVLCELQTKTTGNMTKETMPFFAGTVSLGQDFEIDDAEGKRVMLSLNRPAAAVSEVWINGKLASELPWAPFDVDITNYVVKGINRLMLKLYSGNRNLLGPHHHVKGEVYNVGPDSFTGRWSWVEKESEAKPATKQEREMSYWSDRYCFVCFGYTGK